MTAAGAPQPPAGELHRLRTAVDTGELSDVVELVAVHDDMMVVLPWPTCGDGAAEGPFEVCGSASTPRWLPEGP